MRSHAEYMHMTSSKMKRQSRAVTRRVRAFGPEPDAIAHRNPTLSADESAVFPMRVEIVTI